MRTLVVSDLHSNAGALRAVLAHVRRKRTDRIVCLGDFVGYGAQPNQVLDRMRTHRAAKLYIRGNHDRVAAGFDEGLDFNQPARTAALWTRGKLSRPNQIFLRNLTVGPVTDDSGILFCHGSPADEDEYLFSTRDIGSLKEAFPEPPIIFFGHTHIGVVFEITPRGDVHATPARSSMTFRLDPANQYVINPGSVGQPRDRIPLASCLIHDSARATIQFFRVPYDVNATQRSIVDAGLPRLLAERLTAGT
ncbi:MAG: metallophosphoesterase family protein [Thermoanaerobaculia bacterium]